MAEAARKRTTRPKASSRAEPAPEPEAPHVCTVALCPICFAVAALQPLAPEVIEHLLKAGTELLLAVRAVMDSRADDLREGGDGARRLERIDIA